MLQWGTQAVFTQTRWWTQDCGEDFWKRSANLHRKIGTREGPDNGRKKTQACSKMQETTEFGNNALKSIYTKICISFTT